MLFRSDLLFNKITEVQHEIKKGTIAILVRTNSDINSIIREAKLRNIEIESDYSENLYHTQSAIDLCKLCTALCNPYNEIYLLDLILSNNMNVQFNPLCLKSKTITEKKNILIEVLDEFFENRMDMKWLELVKYAQTNPVLKVLREINLASQPWINFSNGFTNQQYYRINYDILFEKFINMDKDMYITLNLITNRLKLAITTGVMEPGKSIDYESEKDIKIICTTIHKSKGLEYDTVILPFNDFEIDKLKQNNVEITNFNNKLGYYISTGKKIYDNKAFYVIEEIDEIIKEETRILYVAMTRTINRFIYFFNEDDDKFSWNLLLKDVIKNA